MPFKSIGFTAEQIEKIQKFANANCNGNFTEAVRQLVKKGLLNE